MITTSEIIISSEHIDPKKYDDFMVYKLGSIKPVREGKREAAMLWGHVRGGITPHIGANGNWYIGLVDTGIQAAGTDGDDGRGISSVDLFSTVGLVKTYRITFSDSTTFDYTVTDGSGGGGSDIIAGNGMDFETNAPVTLGLPSIVSSDTVNEVTADSHTHELGTIRVSDMVEGDPVELGASYNWWAATDARKITSSDDWVIGDRTHFTNLRTGVDSGGNENSNVAGSKMKEVGFIYWNSPNTGADNSSGFNGRGAGFRSQVDGSFSSLNVNLKMWMSESYNADYAHSASLGYSDETFLTSGPTIGAMTAKKQGISVRLLYIGVGTPTDYTGNDGRVYPVKLMPDGKYWISCNLNETRYRNGDYIHGFENGVYTPIPDADWALLETEALCYYADNEANGGGETPLETILANKEHNSLKEIQGGTENERYHLTLEELEKLQGLGSSIEDIAFEFCDVVAGTAKTYTLDIKASFGYTIEKACLETDNGTLIGVAVKINATDVTSLSSITVDTAVDETSSTGAKTVVAGDRVYLVVATTYTGTPTLIRGKLVIQRT